MAAITTDKIIKDISGNPEYSKGYTDADPWSCIAVTVELSLSVIK